MERHPYHEDMARRRGTISGKELANIIFLIIVIVVLVKACG